MVRLSLVPAVMSFLGDRAWRLPGWLDRLLPNVDIEGEGLQVSVPESPGTPSLPAATGWS